MTDSNPKCSSRSRSDSPLADLLTNLFMCWRQEGIQFLILRNYENLPRATTNDVDVLVLEDQIREAERLMVETAEKTGYLLHNRVEFATISFFFHHTRSLDQLQIDLFTRTQWHCFDMLPTDGVLARRVDRDLFAIPSPVDEAIISLLSRLIYQGCVRDKYKAQIHSAVRAGPDLAVKLLGKAFGSEIARRVVAAVLEENWHAIESLASTMRRRLVARRLGLFPTATLAAMLADAGRLFRRFSRPGGLVVAVLGADGSGKTTISNSVIGKLRNTFNLGKLLEVHWKPVVFLRKQRVGDGSPNVDPHGKSPRGRLLSIAYLLFHWVEFMIGSYVLFRKTTFKNGMVLIDRYYYDFLVDKRRFRLQVPDGLILFLFRWVRSPDLVFLFDAPAEVLQARKQEVPFEESERQAAAYRQIVNRLPQGIRLDATQPVERVADEMTRSILDYLHHRSRERSD